MNCRRALRSVQLLLGFRAAASWAPSAAAWAPYRLPSADLPSVAAPRVSSLAYARHSADDVPPLPTVAAAGGLAPLDGETLDAEVDRVDKRYGASEWFQNIVSLPNSTILSDIKSPVGWIAAWSTLVSVAYKTCRGRGWDRAAETMCLGSTPHSLIASSIGLLLVFRTNSAYQRFTEGRKVWEQLLNTCRDITRMTSIYETEVGSRTKQRIQRLLAAFPYLLHHHIHPRCLDRARCEALRHTPRALLLSEPRASRRGRARECWADRRSLPWCLLPDAVLAKCARSHNRPLWVADRLAREVADIPYGDNWTSRERLDLLKSVGKLSECVGNCERLHQTAVPLNYARHALRSLTLWSFTLPFGLVDKLGLLTGPTAGLVAWLMFGVYQIGHTIEDPFQGSLRLTDMCNSICRDVMYGDRNEAGRRRESAFRKEGEADGDWDALGDTFGLGRTAPRRERTERYAGQLALGV